MRKICKNDLYRSNIYFLLILLGSIFVPFLLAYVFYFVGIRDTRIKLVLSHIILFLVPAVIYFIVTKKNVKETLRLNKLHIEDIGIVLLIAVLTYPLMSCAALISSLFAHNNLGDYVSSISSTPYVVMILLFGVMPAITEEITLRGIVLSGYNNQSKFKAALVTGILFGIFHLDLHQFLYASVLGFVMAYLVRVTNSIFSSMIVHFTVNSLSVTLQKVASFSTSATAEAADNVNLTTISFDEKMAYVRIAVLIGICLLGVIFKLMKVLERWDYERKLAYGLPLDEQGYRGNDVNQKESIINIPLVLIVVVYVTTMLIIK